MELVTIPISWSQYLLGDIATVVTKGTTPTTAGYKYETQGIRFVKVENIDRFGINISSITEFISLEAHEALARSQFREGDVLFSIAGTIGKTALVSSEHLPANTNQAVAIIRGVTDAFLPEFLKYQLQRSAVEIQKANARGGAMNNISLGDLKASLMLVPPLAEQKVIADKLDTLLAQVDKTKARLERIPEILKRFRQSVLAAAVSGKLTEEWREQSGLSWPTEHSNLGDLLELLYGKSLPAATRSGEGYPVYGSNGQVGRHNEYLVEGPFIIVGRKGSYGEVNWSEENGWPIDTTYYVDLKQNANLKFVFFLLQTLGLNQLNRSTAIPGLNREDAYEQTIEIPKISEQTEIVRRVEELFAFADRIERAAQAALSRVNNLTQSILAKAFRGELTADWRAANPELISGENSAEALLARIKAERAKLKPKPKKAN